MISVRSRQLVKTKHVSATFLLMNSGQTMDIETPTPSLSDLEAKMWYVCQRLKKGCSV